MITKDTLYKQTEEFFNTLTHGIGAVLSLVVLILMICLSYNHTTIEIFSLTVYGISLVLLYTCSTIYHAATCPKLKSKFQILDHMAIYILIAGTYTPFMLLSVKGQIGWIIFSAVWIIAGIGVIFKFFFTGRFDRLSSLLYIGMGWISILAIKSIFNALSTEALVLLFVGGFFYTFGVVFYLWDKLKFNHAIWHLFVLAGSASHFAAIFLDMVPSNSVA